MLVPCQSSHQLIDLLYDGWTMNEHIAALASTLRDSGSKQTGLLVSWR